MLPNYQEIRYLTLCYKSELGKLIVSQNMPKHYSQIKFGAGSE